MTQNKGSFTKTVPDFSVFYIKFMDFWSLLNLKLVFNEPTFQLNLSLKSF